MSDVSQAVADFFLTCSAEISRRVSSSHGDDPVLQNGAARFADAVTDLTSLEHEPSSVPLETCLGEIETNRLSDTFAAASDHFSWVPSHRMTDQGTEAALAMLNHQFDFGDLTVGMVLLGPGCRYPEHGHPPHEVYLPISDGGRWRYGGASDYVTLAPDALVYNHPDDEHGIVAGDQPLLALYVLWPS